MNDADEYITFKAKRGTRARLEATKEHPRETVDDALDRILTFYERREIIEALAELKGAVKAS